MFVYPLLIIILFVFVVLFFNVEVSLLKYDDNGWRVGVVGRLHCGSPERLVCNSPDDAFVRASFMAGTSLAMYGSHLPAPLDKFLLALPRLQGTPPLIGASFAMRGFQFPVATTIVFDVLTSRLAARRHDSVFIDVGAGTGYFSAIAATLGWPTVTLEANTQLAASLQLTAFANGWYATNRSVLHMKTADATSGQQKRLFVAPERVERARIFERNNDDPTHAQIRDDHLQSTLTITIDELVPKSLDIAFLFIDAEDSHVSVLDGAANFAPKCKIQNILITQTTLSGDVFAKIRKIHELINKCRYRVKLFEEKFNAKKLSKLDYKSVEKYMETWTPGAEWPIGKSMWLYFPEDPQIDKDPLGEDRFVSL